MKIKEAIEQIKKHVTWVDYNCTRDVIICGDENTEIKKIGVCWVATLGVLKQAKEKGINFVISHENPLYVEGTAIHKCFLDKRKEKIQFCKDNGITIYRLHDGWDQFPEYGICDYLAKATGLPFEQRDIHSMHQKAELNGKYTVKEIAHMIAQGLKECGSNHVEVLGDINKKVNILAMGVGAATYVPLMNSMQADCMVVSYDGTNGWIDQQWAVDSEIPLIIFHHYVNEVPGITGMKDFLTKEFVNIETIQLKENYNFTIVE